jgi:hypothetical protein
MSLCDLHRLEWTSFRGRLLPAPVECAGKKRNAIIKKLQFSIISGSISFIERTIV